MIMQLVGFLIIAGLIFLAITTVDRNPNMRVPWMIIGCILFFTGSICLIVNTVGITIGFLAWIETMGKLGSFLFKLSLVIAGVVIFALVNHNPDSYDEYFDGNKYQ